MPYKGTPCLQQGRLEWGAGDPIWVDTPAWFAWLDTSIKFCYATSATYNVTAHRQPRGAHWYWYAYLKTGSKLYNAYLGQTAQLTSARLQQVGSQLVDKARQARKEVSP